MLPADGPLAGCALGRRQALVQDARGLRQLVRQLPLQADVAAAGAAVAPHQVGEPPRQDLLQPAHQFGLRGPAEPGEMAVRFQERVLNEVGGIDLALQPVADL